MSQRIDVTDCLDRIRAGDSGAARELAALVYEDLKARAENLVRQRPAGNVSATTLVHEAYFKLNGGAALQAGNREHFLALASKIMRDLLVDMARRQSAQKRGGAGRRLTVTMDRLPGKEGEVDVLGVHEALAELGSVDPRLVEIVEMRFFGGMTGDEIAGHLGVTRRTVVRELRMAQAWLRKRLDERPQPETDE